MVAASGHPFHSRSVILDVLPYSWRIAIATKLYALYIRTSWVVWYCEIGNPEIKRTILHGMTGREFLNARLEGRLKGPTDVH
ncbi:hypothetical protein [Nitrobacter sp. JJSN]|uniref:hypothetical protein n=1 Tax=Nitrobacter sp. JJSN TaxID=3453033 RepID=UPI003F76B420